MDHTKVPKNSTKPWYQPHPVTTLANMAVFPPTVQQGAHRGARNKPTAFYFPPNAPPAGLRRPRPSPAHCPVGPEGPQPVPWPIRGAETRSPGGNLSRALLEVDE